MDLPFYILNLSYHAQLLVEWGCDVLVKGPKDQTAFEAIKNEDFRDFLISE